MSVQVALSRCENYDEHQVYQSVAEAVENAGGLSGLKGLGKKVLLKTNLLFGAAPDKAATTHPAVVAAAVRLFQEAGFDVQVGDSPGIESTLFAAKKAGIADVCEKLGVPLADFGEAVERENPEGKIVKRFQIAKAAAGADIIVSLPKLKTHGMMYYTGAMKNLFGTVVGLQKAQFHMRYPDRTRFAEMIVDLNLCLKPSFAIMDGIVAMEGQGPTNGTPKKVGAVLASSDVLALDLTASRLIGYDPRSIPILSRALARKNSPWVQSIDQIEIKGEKIDDLRPESFNKIRIVSDIGFIKELLPAPVFGFIRDLVVARPVFKASKCIRCGRCVKICPAQALTLDLQKGKAPAVDYNQCIRCYCCDEVCPEKAIGLKRILF